MRISQGDTYSIPPGRSRTSRRGFSATLVLRMRAPQRAQPRDSYPYHNPFFPFAPTRLCTQILTLYVCRSVVVEWSKALLGPGSHLVVAKIIFFFFLSFSTFLLRLLVVRGLVNGSR